MAAPRAKVFEYQVEVGADGRVSLPGEAALSFPSGWSPDHLLLAALVRCSIESLAYHARRAGHDVEARGFASGRVTKRETDDRYAFVEVECRIEAELTPPASDPAELGRLAARDCFVGASLTVTPQYEWLIDGNQVPSSR